MNECSWLSHGVDCPLPLARANVRDGHLSTSGPVAPSSRQKFQIEDFKQYAQVFGLRSASFSSYEIDTFLTFVRRRNTRERLG